VRLRRAAAVGGTTCPRSDSRTPERPCVLPGYRQPSEAPRLPVLGRSSIGAGGAPRAALLPGTVARCSRTALTSADSHPARAASHGVDCTWTFAPSSHRIGCRDLPANKQVNGD